MGQTRHTNRKKGRAKQTKEKHRSEDTGPQTAPDLPKWLDLDSANAAQKDTVQRKCQAQAQAPKEVQELYGSFLPTNGLLCSRVCSAEGEMLFVHPSYSDHASLGTCHSPFTPSTSSNSAPCATEGSCSSSEDKCASPSLDVAKQPGPTRLERQQAQCFAEKYQRGQVQLCLALVPRDNASEDPENWLSLPLYVEDLRATFPPETTVQIVSGAGIRFTGVLPVDGDACLVFDPTCSDAVISDSMATGGMLVCYGRGCHVTFSNCHFDLATRIVALAGASVQLTGCTFTRNGFNVVFARAYSTCVTVDSCFFSGGGHPVSVAGGASVTVAGSTFNRPLVNAMVVRGKGSLLKAENCRVQGPKPTTPLHAPPSTASTQPPTPPTEGGQPRGVLVGMGARLELSSTDIANVGRGVTVYQGSAAVLADCSVAGVTAVSSFEKDLCCIQSFSSSNVELSRCVLDGENENSADDTGGIYARDSSVKLQGCRVLRNKCGVTLSCSQGVLADCEFENSGATSVFAAHHSFLDMCACVCKQTESYGVQVLESDCRLQSVTVVGSDTGFCLDKVRSDAVITDCEAVDIRRCGLRVNGGGGTGALVRVQGFEMRRNALQKTQGIVVHRAGRADLVNCKVAAKYAVTAAEKWSEVRGVDCQLSGGAGASAMGGSQMTLRRCASRERARGHHVEEGGVLQLQNCTSTEDDVGFSCGMRGSLHAEDCELRSFSCGAFFNIKNGVGGATCKLDRCSFLDSNRTATKQDWCPSGVGVYLGGEGAHLSMHGCTVSGTTSCCVWVTENAKATLERCHLSHSQTDCVRCVFQSSEITLDGCNVSKNDGYGVSCYERGRVVARRVHSRGNKEGGSSALGGGSMTLKECSSDRDEVGCFAFGARVVLSGVLVRRSTRAGFVFDRHAKGCMKHCAALQCGEGGMVVVPAEHGGLSSSRTAPGLSVFDSTFQRCGGGGVAVHGGCAVGMQNVLCSRNVGWAFMSKGAGSRLALTRCEVDGSSEPYRCAGGGKLHCIECRPSGPCIQH